MDPKADFHASVFGKDYVGAAHYEVRIDPPTHSIESEGAADRTGVSQHADDGAC